MWENALTFFPSVGGVTTTYYLHQASSYLLVGAVERLVVLVYVVGVGAGEEAGELLRHVDHLRIVNL